MQNSPVAITKLVDSFTLKGERLKCRLINTCSLNIFVFEMDDTQLKSGHMEKNIFYKLFFLLLNYEVCINKCNPVKPISYQLIMPIITYEIFLYDHLDVNECESSPCKHGTCVDRVGRYECACAPEWKGINCDGKTAKSL